MESPQGELFESTRALNTRLLITLARLVLGDAADQKLAIDDLVDMVASEITVARRMQRILEADPVMIERHPQFYAKVVSAAGG